MKTPEILWGGLVDSDHMSSILLVFLYYTTAPVDMVHSLLLIRFQIDINIFISKIIIVKENNF